MRATKTLGLILGLLCLISCGKENSEPQEGCSNCGTYYLSKALWDSNGLDLNGDGTGNEDLIYEFKELQGFLESKRFAKLYKSPTTEGEIFINLHIPYHDVRKVGEEYYDYGCGYLESSIQGKNNGASTDESDFLAEEYNYSAPGDVGLNGLHKAAVYKLGNKGIRIHVEMTVYDYQFQPHKGTLYLFYEKIGDICCIFDSK